jgi:hypothetical protein
MEKCPQCDANRIPDENFCDSCGNKYPSTSNIQASESKIESKSESFDDYEKDYLKRLDGESSESQANTGESQANTGESQANTGESQANTGESQANTGEEIRGAIWIPTVTGNEQPIYFEFNQKAIGRMDLSEYLKSQNIDQLQISRKQFTFYTENGKYYIVDDKTSVQEKPSGNHTTVNGKDITGQGSIELHSNDNICMSTVVNMIFKIS